MAAKLHQAILAERFRRYDAERYGFRRGSLSKAIADMIERELEIRWGSGSGTIDGIVGLGLPQTTNGVVKTLLKRSEGNTAYLIDANIILEALYKRSRWEEYTAWHA